MTKDATLEYQGGNNYLIDLPPGATADVQVYNPSFAPDTCGGGSTAPPYCYHENDTSFNGTGSVCTEYSAMEYTMFLAPTLSSRAQDSKVGQEVFYPYNATPGNMFYYAPGPPAGSCPSQTALGSAPPTYHQWVSVLTYNPTAASDPENFNAAAGGAPSSSGNRLNAYISNPAGATVDKFYRLEVDSLQWNGTPHCKATVGPCALPELHGGQWRQRFLERAQGIRGTARQPGHGRVHQLRLRLRDGRHDRVHPGEWRVQSTVCDSPLQHRPHGVRRSDDQCRPCSTSVTSVAAPHTSAFVSRMA